MVCGQAVRVRSQGPNPKDLVGLRKPRLALVPPALVLHTSEAMRNGAEKYDPYNYRQNPVLMTVYIEAAMRHLLSMLDGEDAAKDSKVLHAAHVAACMGVILDCTENGNMIDDRPPAGNAPELIERLTRKGA